mgnify:CR=1 FL=1
MFFTSRGMMGMVGWMAFQGIGLMFPQPRRGVSVAKETEDLLTQVLETSSSEVESLLSPRRLVVYGWDKR